MPGHRPVLIAAAAAALLLAACGGGASGSTVPPLLPGEVAVDARDLTFSPNHLTVQQGQTVVFRMRDVVAHNVVADDFRSKDISKGIYKHRFDQPGTYSYKCTLHPTMTGDVTVR